MSLVHVWKQRVEFPALKRMVVTLADTYKPNAILVEDKASGQSLIQEMKRETALPILAVKVDADKVARAYAVTPAIEGRESLSARISRLAGRLPRQHGFFPKRRPRR